jgi:hypothetical protein
MALMKDNRLHPEFHAYMRVCCAPLCCCTAGMVLLLASYT